MNNYWVFGVFFSGKLKSVIAKALVDKAESQRGKERGKGGERREREGEKGADTW